MALAVTVAHGAAPHGVPGRDGGKGTLAEAVRIERKLDACGTLPISPFSFSPSTSAGSAGVRGPAQALPATWFQLGAARGVENLASVRAGGPCDFDHLPDASGQQRTSER